MDLAQLHCVAQFRKLMCVCVVLCAYLCVCGAVCHCLQEPDENYAHHTTQYVNTQVEECTCKQILCAIRTANAATMKGSHVWSQV